MWHTSKEKCAGPNAEVVPVSYQNFINHLAKYKEHQNLT